MNRTAWRRLLPVVVLAGFAAGCAGQPSSVTSAASAPPSRSSQTHRLAGAPEATAPSPGTTCDGRTGDPEWVTIEALGIVRAPVEDIPTEPMVSGTIGEPKDKTKMGWQGNEPGVVPGSCRGTVLMTGHTYHDGSALFKETYAGIPMSKVDKRGMVVQVGTRNGTFHYQIDWQVTVEAADYATYTERNDLYDIDRQRPEEIFIATCTDWDGSEHTTETMIKGHRIPAP